MTNLKNYFKKIPANNQYIICLKKIVRSTNFFISWLLYYPYIIKFNLSLKRKYSNLQIGCGKNLFNSWINSDISYKADLIVFLHKKIPLKPNSIKFIYTEHVIEHVSYSSALKFLINSKKVLKKDGVIRIATPDLDYLIKNYTNDWKSMNWVNWPEYKFIKTKAEMLNIAFRWWGHKHLYNKEELTRLLNEAGFTKYMFKHFGESDYKELNALETRKDSRLIVEAIK